MCMLVAKKWRLILNLSLCLIVAGCQLPNAQPPVPSSNGNSPTRVTTTSTKDTSKRQTPVGSSGTGQAAWTLLDNRRMRVADYQGKVVVLDFWATYCPPCVAETAHLVALQKQYGKLGLTIIGLNVGGAEDQPKIPDFVSENKVPYDIGFPDGSLVDSLMGTDDSIPQTFVFDRKGHLVKSFVGFAPDSAGEIEAAIQTALKSQ